MAIDLKMFADKVKKYCVQFKISLDEMSICIDLL